MAFSFYRQTIWNRANKLVRLVSDEAWKWARSAQEENKDPLEFSHEFIEDRSRTAAWILRMLELGAKDLWDGLLDRDPDFIQAVWKKLFPRTNDSANSIGISFWVDASINSRLRILTPTAWIEHKDGKKIEQHMPKPGPE